MSDTSISLNPAAAVFNLGFYSRHFDSHVLIGSVSALAAEIHPNSLAVFLHVCRESVTSPNLVTATNDLLKLSHPGRVLFDLGVALACSLTARRKTLQSEAGQVWECVSRLPDHLVRPSDCLTEIRQAYGGSDDLDAIMKRMIARRSPSNVDDQHEHKRFLCGRPTITRENGMKPNEPLEVIFAAEVSRDLLAANLAPSPQTDPATEARNAWIYKECCAGTNYAQIQLSLKKKAKENEKWDYIETPPCLKAAAKRYANRHGLPLPLPRKRGRRPS